MYVYVYVSVCVRVSEQNSAEQYSALHYTTVVESKRTGQKERLKSTYVLAELSADGSDGLVECRGVHHHLAVRRGTEDRSFSLSFELNWSLRLSLRVSLNCKD
jgi:hypothetical protein